MSATAEFRLSITRALGDQLADALSRLTPMGLTVGNAATLAARGGVYQLYLENELVYIGKADRSLVERIGNHRRKISGRLGISLDHMSFIAMYVDEDLNAVAPETLLINRGRGEGKIPWNFNGFGNKDPGRERDTSKVEEKHFDSLYPADLDYVCHSVLPKTYYVGDLLVLLKAELPYVFRYQDGSKRRENQPPDYWKTTVTVTQSELTADKLFGKIVGAMPGWQITALPGYSILYHEARTYQAARKVYQHVAGGVGYP